MRFIVGFLAIGLLAASYVVCPDSLREQVSNSMMPDAQTLVDLENGIAALMRHLDGPGDMNPDAPV